jgi:RNA polymerase sigma-70 factor (ECF subfamily)
LGAFTTTRFQHLGVAHNNGRVGAASSPGGVCETTDEALISLTEKGDREALSVLFRRHSRLVHNVGRRILRDNGEADDLVQEVFLYVHRKSGLYDASKGTARSWIVQVAYTQAFLRRRQLKARGFYSSRNVDNSSETGPRASSGADYDQTVEGIFGRNGWRRILDVLTHEQRETLRLHFFEGYTFTEIAEKLGQSYANVRNYHYRGLEKLRKHLAEDESNGRQSVCYESKSDGKSRRLPNGSA